MHVLRNLSLLLIAAGAFGCGDQPPKTSRGSQTTAARQPLETATDSAPFKQSAPDASEPLPRSELENCLDELEQQISGVGQAVGVRQ